MRCFYDTCWLLYGSCRIYYSSERCLWKYGFCSHSQSDAFIIVLYHEGGADRFPSILTITLYASMQDSYVCYFWTVFKGNIWNNLYFPLIIFFGLVNKLPHYLASLTLSILLAHLKQVMDNNYHLAAVSTCLRVKITLILWLEKDPFYRKCLTLSSSLSLFSLYLSHLKSTKNSL